MTASSDPPAGLLAEGVVALDWVPDPIVVVDGEGLIRHASPLACRLVAEPLDAIVGRPARKILRLRDADGADWWELARPLDADAKLLPRIPEQDLTLHVGDASRPVAVTGARMPDKHGGVALLVLALRRVESRRRRDAARTDLVSTVSHELRSPLTSVKGFTKTLLAKWERFNDEQKKQMLEVVNADADRVTRLLGELLAVSRIDAGRLHLQREIVDVGTRCRGVVDRLAVASDRRIDLDLPDDMPPLYVDPDRVEQIFGNLLENAVKYTHGTIRVTAAVAEDHVRFSIIDEGPGIDNRYLSSIFSKFFRPPGERQQGTGLGLYITKGLVEAHGGEVWAESPPGQGASFHFTLPRGGLELAGIDIDALRRDR